MERGKPKGLVKSGGRKQGTPNKTTTQVKEQAQEFFHLLIDDETEAKFWRYFMSGYVVDIQEDGTQRIIPIPLDPIKWNSFKRAVEYKRGMPVQPVVGKLTGTIEVKLVTNASFPTP